MLPSTFIFEVWATGGNKKISNWYYVNPGKGEFWQIDAPAPPNPRAQAPDVYTGLVH